MTTRRGGRRGSLGGLVGTFTGKKDYGIGLHGSADDFSVSIESFVPPTQGEDGYENSDPSIGDEDDEQQRRNNPERDDRGDSSDDEDNDDRNTASYLPNGALKNNNGDQNNNNCYPHHDEDDTTSVYSMDGGLSLESASADGGGHMHGSMLSNHIRQNAVNRVRSANDGEASYIELDIMTMLGPPVTRPKTPEPENIVPPESIPESTTADKDDAAAATNNEKGNNATGDSASTALESDSSDEQQNNTKEKAGGDEKEGGKTCHSPKTVVATPRGLRRSLKARHGTTPRTTTTTEHPQHAASGRNSPEGAEGGGRSERTSRSHRSCQSSTPGGESDDSSHTECEQDEDEDEDETEIEEEIELVVEITENEGEDDDYEEEAVNQEEPRTPSTRAKRKDGRVITIEGDHGHGHSQKHHGQYHPTQDRNEVSTSPVPNSCSPPPSPQASTNKKKVGCRADKRRPSHQKSYDKSSSPTTTCNIASTENSPRGRTQSFDAEEDGASSPHVPPRKLDVAASGKNSRSDRMLDSGTASPSQRKMNLMSAFSAGSKSLRKVAGGKGKDINSAPASAPAPENPAQATPVGQSEAPDSSMYEYGDAAPDDKRSAGDVGLETPKPGKTNRKRRTSIPKVFSALVSGGGDGGAVPPKEEQSPKTSNAETRKGSISAPPSELDESEYCTTNEDCSTQLPVEQQDESISPGKSQPKNVGTRLRSIMKRVAMPRLGTNKKKGGNGGDQATSSAEDPNDFDIDALDIDNDEDDAEESAVQIEYELDLEEDEPMPCTASPKEKLKRKKGELRGAPSTVTSSMAESAQSGSVRQQHRNHSKRHSQKNGSSGVGTGASAGAGAGVSAGGGVASADKQPRRASIPSRTNSKNFSESANKRDIPIEPPLSSSSAMCDQRKSPTPSSIEDKIADCKIMKDCGLATSSGGTKDVQIQDVVEDSNVNGPGECGSGSPDNSPVRTSKAKVVSPTKGKRLVRRVRKVSVHQGRSRTHSEDGVHVDEEVEVVTVAAEGARESEISTTLAELSKSPVKPRSNIPQRRASCGAKIAPDAVPEHRIPPMKKEDWIAGGDVPAHLINTSSQPTVASNPKTPSQSKGRISGRRASMSRVPTSGCEDGKIAVGVSPLSPIGPAQEPSPSPGRKGSQHQNDQGGTKADLNTKKNAADDDDDNVSRRRQCGQRSPVNRSRSGQSSTGHKNRGPALPQVDENNCQADESLPPLPPTDILDSPTRTPKTPTKGRPRRKSSTRPSGTGVSNNRQGKAQEEGVIPSEVMPCDETKRTTPAGDSRGQRCQRKSPVTRTKSEDGLKQANSGSGETSPHAKLDTIGNDASKNILSSSKPTYGQYEEEGSVWLEVISPAATAVPQPTPDQNGHRQRRASMPEMGGNNQEVIVCGGNILLM